MIKVVFCIPGKNFSLNFLRSWTNLISHLPTYKVDFSLNGAVSSNVYLARLFCLIEKQNLPTHQQPFDGLYYYDYMMWIDSDIIFEPWHFKKLLETMEKNKKIMILSGLYFQDQGGQYAAVAKIKSQPLKNQAKPLFLTPQKIKHQTKLIKVVYSGMGFMLIRKGVFEKLPYPWFLPVITKTENTTTFASEDASFCFQAQEQGFEIWVDPKVIVGHEKLTFIKPERC